MLGALPACLPACLPATSDIFIFFGAYCRSPPSTSTTLTWQQPPPSSCVADWTRSLRRVCFGSGERKCGVEVGSLRGRWRALLLPELALRGVQGLDC